nr:MAG TPA_asm: putative nucleotidyltransferase [Caudoviricetes sp.]
MIEIPQLTEVLDDSHGLPVFIAGSAVAASVYEHPHAFSDIDMFCPSDVAFITAIEHLRSKGYEFAPRFKRVWQRWLKLGIGNWHTNSMHLRSPRGTDVNVVYKLIGKKPTTSLSQVLESFDFGLLTVGYEAETRTFRDLRPYMFPDLDPVGPLPLMPNKRNDWVNGFISQYNGLRECGRYAKYHNYGYDLSAVKDDLVVGYYNAALYLADRDKPEKKQLGLIYEAIAGHIQVDNIDQLVEASKQILYLDSLDDIMESLE